VGTVSVPHDPASAGEVRRQLIEDLQSRHIHVSSVEEAALLVTELVGNAVRHARPLPGGRILVSWRVEAGRLQVRVTDGGNTTEEPHLAHAGPNDTHGRGLAIVDALSALWGVDTSRGSTTVWATLPVHAAPADVHPDAGARVLSPPPPGQRITLDTAAPRDRITRLSSRADRRQLSDVAPG
jgi:anti-sigma regulatory factor (Ser/Thr protein kinase)